jgi:hypothetical protein
MKIKVTVTSQKGNLVSEISEVSKEGDVAAVVSRAFDTFRKKHPDDSLIDSQTKIEHA